MDSDGSTFEGRDLHLELGGRSGLRSSLEEALREAIRSGRLTALTRLPSTRALAADLGLARGTVTDAYDQLAAEGWLVARQGSGTRVASAPMPAEEASPSHGQAEPESATAPRHDFRPGRGDLSSFPRGAWVAALRRALREAQDSVLDYGDPRGLRVLRQALAGYIGRARGLPVDPDRLVVCNGWVQGFALITEALRDAGARRVAIEDPSMARNSASLRRFGLGVVSVSVDHQGADPTALARRGSVSAALLTPAHQYPTGATLSADRRAAWISWARHHDAVLIEDDYDGEFRYDRQPVGALAALDPGRVIYGGTTSKTLAPGLRLGWLVLPRRWLEPVTDLRPIVDRHTGALEQLALAEMIASGAYDRHVRHSRMRYRRRRDLLLTLLADQVPAVTPHGIAAGLHTVIDLPVGGPTEDEVIDHLARADVAVHGLAGYHHRTGTRTRAALVVGFATPPEHAFAVDARALVASLAGLYR
ncbi:MAG TPA: PLP-dependent aminotransferase family protein [Acidimicrobiales bacterium]|jgi:GntR family transcriptional regulator/MocR family aminotransferase|nr:PLP-dependent aminotransferase family protein [Acidimicrobiales bacterium]